MLKTGICLAKYGYDVTHPEAMRILKQAGFDSFFTGWTEDDNLKFHSQMANEAAKIGMVYESIHAPFGGINCIWEDGEEGEAYRKSLRRCVEDAAACGVLYITAHIMNVPQYNTANPPLWSELGVSRFADIVSYAADKGIKVAFENVEFPQYQLHKLIQRLRDIVPQGLGFCWDTGHEHCYPAGSTSVPELFGDLIIGTHMHDNFGQANPAIVTWDDDVHIMPFDGTINYHEVGQKLKGIGYTGTVTLEIGRGERQWNILPWYQHYTFEEFASQAHEKARRIAILCD